MMRRDILNEQRKVHVRHGNNATAGPLADPSSHHLLMFMAMGSGRLRRTAPPLFLIFVSLSAWKGSIHSLAFFFYIRRSATIPSLRGTLSARLFIARVFYKDIESRRQDE